MIIIEIGRGLGNSLFVYAAGKALAEHHNTELKLDCSYLRSWPKMEKYGGDWEPELKRLNISAKEVTKREIKKFVRKTGIRPIDKIIRKYRLFEKNVYYFPTSGALKEFFDLPDNIFLWGYFGHEKFFKSIKNIIKKEFILKEENKNRIKPLLNKISKERSISIHVRRGDLLNIKNGYILPIEYYQKAISKIKDLIKDPIFYVFSDEIDWCKKNLILGNELIFVKGNKGWEDLELMKTCKHNILANSALSWWAGYLNDNPNNIIITPKKFSHFANVNNDIDILPKKWIEIET